MATPPASCSSVAETDAAAPEARALAVLAQLLGSEVASAVAEQRVQERPLPRLALSPEEAARTLGVSRDFFDEHLLPELRIVRRGRRRLIPLRELERWLEQA